MTPDKPGSVFPVILLHLLSKSRDDLENITDDPIICEPENGRIRVLVNRDYHFRVYHANSVLNGSRDAACDVECRGDSSSCLSNLVRVRPPTGVDRSSRCSDDPAHYASKFLENLVVLRYPHSPSSGHDHSRLSEILFLRPVGHKLLYRHSSGWLLE